MRDYAQPLLGVAKVNSGATKIYLVGDRTFNAFVAEGRNIFINAGALVVYDEVDAELRELSKRYATLLAMDPPTPQVTASPRHSGVRQQPERSIAPHYFRITGERIGRQSRKRSQSRHQRHRRQPAQRQAWL